MNEQTRPIHSLFPPNDKPPEFSSIYLSFFICLFIQLPIYMSLSIYSLIHKELDQESFIRELDDVRSS